jgi:hypothetical protein
MKMEEASGGRKKKYSWIYFLLSVLVVASRLYKGWTGHFSSSGFAVGLLICVPIYLWIAWGMTKAVKREFNPDEDVVTAETRQRGLYRFLILLGLVSVLVAPTLKAFAWPF